MDKVHDLTMLYMKNHFSESDAPILLAQTYAETYEEIAKRFDFLSNLEEA